MTIAVAIELSFQKEHAQIVCSLIADQMVPTVAVSPAPVLVRPSESVLPIWQSTCFVHQILQLIFVHSIFQCWGGLHFEAQRRRHSAPVAQEAQEAQAQEAQQ